MFFFNFTNLPLVSLSIQKKSFCEEKSYLNIYWVITSKECQVPVKANKHRILQTAQISTFVLKFREWLYNYINFSPQRLNRRFLCSWYRAGTNLQWRLRWGNIIKKRLMSFLAHSLHHTMNEYHGHQMWNGMCRQNGMCVDGNEWGIWMRLQPEIILHAKTSACF